MKKEEKKQKIEELEEQGKKIRQDIISFLQQVSINIVNPQDDVFFTEEYFWGELSPDLVISREKMLDSYKKWYSMCFFFIEKNFLEDEEEFLLFRKPYEPILDKINLRVPAPRTIDEFIHTVTQDITHQIDIMGFLIDFIQSDIENYGDEEDDRGEPGDITQFREDILKVYYDDFFKKDNIIIVPFLSYLEEKFSTVKTVHIKNSIKYWKKMGMLSVDEHGYGELINDGLDCEITKQGITHIENKGKSEAKIIENYDKILIFPETIEKNKYLEIFQMLETPKLIFQQVFIVENILRLFIIKTIEKHGFSSITDLGIGKLTRTIESRKRDESKNKYLPLRGDHDIYYLDLIELSKIFSNKWELFKDKFDSDRWITQRIDDLYKIRVRVAHNSEKLTMDEARSVETYSREIIKQIDKYI